MRHHEWVNEYHDVAAAEGDQRYQSCQCGARRIITDPLSGTAQHCSIRIAGPLECPINREIGMVLWIAGAQRGQSG